jgi:hypothetical protein
LHYKFLDKYFQEQVEQAVREEHRIFNSAVYKIYKETLDREPTLRIKRDTAREMKSVNDLVEDQFLVVSDDYVHWADAEEEKSVLQVAPQGELRKLAQAFLDSRRQGRAKTLKIQRLERQLREHQNLKKRVTKLQKRNRALKRQLETQAPSETPRFRDRMNRLIKRIVRIIDT